MPNWPEVMGNWAKLNERPSKENDLVKRLIIQAGLLLRSSGLLSFGPGCLVFALASILLSLGNTNQLAIFSSPALAGTLKANSTASPSDEGAKGMFYEQLSHPESSINNGVQYWIELRRQGKTHHVTNKFSFRTGDEIRFHVRTNTDAFAYVVLREGSRGERSVLFPDPRHGDDNRLRPDSDYILPGDGFLIFDSNPGTEKLSLILSRNQVEPAKFMQDGFKAKVVIASSIDGSKDLVPGSFVISMAEKQNVIGGKEEKLLVDSPSQLDHSLENNKPEQVAITVVQKDPRAVLAVDICLEHLP